jgi:ELWxxDGT repeat protein
LLEAHHLITRLTNNEGNFTFDAQVQLDFNATNASGQRVWDPEDLVFRLEQGGLVTESDLSGLLPPEGAFQAIIVDALGGNDRVTVGPTVTKSVWIDGGPGDDTVQIQSGTPILPDATEFPERNDDAAGAFDFGGVSQSTTFTGLTLDSPVDEDWYTFRLGFTPGAGDTLTVRGISALDGLVAEIRDTADTQIALPTSADPVTGVVTLQLGAAKLTAGSVYRLRVTSNRNPTVYAVAFNLPSIPAAGDPLTVNLSSGVLILRRDVILGGDGNDVLSGGSGEDWIFGGAGNDVLTGGLDNQASDLLFGQAGDDTFQIIPDSLPLIPGTDRTSIPTLSDRFDGGAGDDRVLFLGGDLDRLGRPVPDWVAIRYDADHHVYQFTAVAWDIANQRFLRDPGTGLYVQTFVSYQEINVERTVFDTRAGDDEVHADAGYRFPGTLTDWGIGAGDFEQRALIGGLEIHGGDGNDRLFGGAQDDVIDGGSGSDFIVGGPGSDRIVGGEGDDVLAGDGSGAASDLSNTPPDAYEYSVINGQPGRNDDFRFARDLGVLQGNTLIQGLTFNLGDGGDWYRIGTPEALRQFGTQHSAFLTADMIQVVFDHSTPEFDRAHDLFLFAAENTGNAAAPVIEPVEQFTGVPDYYLLHVVNPKHVASTSTGAAAGGYSLRFTAAVGATVDVPGTSSDASIDSTSLADQPAAIPLGDINGDGFQDFIAAVRDDRTLGRSFVRVYFGSTATGNITLSSDAPTWVLPATVLQATLGRQVTFTRGDFNGDGLGDVAITATRSTSDPFPEAGIYLVFGHPGAWAPTLELVKDYSAVIGGLAISASVSGVADVNGDGVDDLVVGDKGAGTVGLIAGRQNWATPLVFSADFSTSTGANAFTLDNTVAGNRTNPFGGIPFDDQVPGLWHLSTRRSGDPGHGGGQSLYFGQEPAANYDVGHTAGRVVSPEIDLTSVGAAGAELSFNYLLDTEPLGGVTAGGALHDAATVSVSTDGGVTWQVVMRNGGGGLVSRTEVGGGWQHATVNLKDFAGRKIRLRFQFDTGDSNDNAHEGWFVDDVSVRAFLDASTLATRFTGPVGTGAAVGGVGDVNGDGRPDFAVIAEDPAGGHGKVSIVFGRALGQPFTPGSLSSLAGSVLTSPSSSLVNSSLGRAGNLDGNPGDEFIVGGDLASFVVTGGPTPILGSPIALRRLQGIGDLNGDGLADLAAVVAQSTPSLNETSTLLHTVVKVFLGARGGLPDFQAPALVLEPAKSDYADTVISRNAGAVGLYRFAGVGDLNGDGRADLVVADNIGGTAHVYFGRALAVSTVVVNPAAPVERFVFGLATPLLSGSSVIPTVTLPDPSGVPVDTQGNVVLTGTSAGDALSGAQDVGDLNGDHFDDFLVWGRSAYILLGPVRLDAAVDVTQRAELIVDATTLGTPAQHMGDVNGDGLADLVFVRANGIQAVVTVIFGRADWPRNVSSALAAGGGGASITVVGPADSTSSDFEALAANWVDAPGETVAHDDLWVVARDRAYLFNGAALAGGGIFPAVAASTQVTRDGSVLPLAAHIAFAGDVNGDGLEDVLFADHDTSAAASAYLLVGRASGSLLPALSVQRNGDAAFPIGFVGGSAFGLGDLNHDGFDDVAIGRVQETGGPDQGSLFIYLGSSALRYDGVTDTLGTSAAAVRILRHQPGELVGGLAALGALTVTAGDYDGDGAMDLVVGETRRAVADVSQAGAPFLDLATRGAVYEFRSIASRGAQLLLASADRILTGVHEQDFLGTLPTTPQLDLDRDGLADLVVGAAGADVAGTTPASSAGTLYVFRGSRLAFILPSNETAIPLENHTVTGSGDFLIDRGTGRPELFQGMDINGDGQDDFVLQVGQSDRWYRFTTLGDGAAGDQIRLLTGAVASTTTGVSGTGGTLTPSGGSFVVNTAAGTIQIGGSVNSLGVMEYDLSGFLDYAERTDSITRVELALDYGTSALPSASTSQSMAAAGPLLYFVANDADHGTELWRTDGTVLGTRLVMDIAPVKFQVFTLGLFTLRIPIPGTGDANPANLLAVGNTLFFTANDGTNGVQLWKTDGTPGGTVRLTSTNVAGGGLSPSNLVTVGSLIYFVGTDGGSGPGVFRFDPSTNILTLVFRAQAGTVPASLTTAGATLYFSGSDATTGNELWRVTGPGVAASQVRDIRVGAAGSAPAGLAAVGNTLFFRASDGVNGVELWRTDGTVAGTVMVANLNAGVADSTPSNLTSAGGLLYFTADDGSGFELYRTNGTTAGTVRVARLNTHGGSAPQELTVLGSFLYFTANGDGVGRELWQVSLGGGAPVLMKDINPGVASAGAGQLTVVGSTLYFTADPGSRVRELWKTDGTPAGTVRVSDRVGGTGAGPSGLVAFGGLLYFDVATPGGVVEPWVSDGTPAGTRRLAEAGLVKRTLMVSVVDAEGDLQVTASDGNAAASRTVSVDLSTVAATDLIRVDLTQIIRDALASGRTRITLRLQMSTAAGDPLTVFVPTDGAHRTGLNVTTAQQSGVRGDLYDAQGGLIVSGRSLFDLRALPAGTYFLRVFNPFAATQPAPLAYGIEVSAPAAGASHALYDQDSVEGDDGNDILIGNGQVDQLLGGRGQDGFVGESFEVRDLEGGEWIVPALPEEGVVRSQAAIPLLDPVVSVPDASLLLALARVVGLPVTTSYLGQPLVHGVLHASDLAGLTRLNLAGLGIRDLTGLEWATNLVALDLANNLVRDLSPVAPRTADSGPFVGTRLGLVHLESLSLDENNLVGVGPLATLVTLRSLSLDNNELVDVSPLGALVNLRFLSLDHTGLGAVAGSPGFGVDYYLLPADVTDLPDLRFLSPAHSRVDAAVNFPSVTDTGFDGFSDLNNLFAARWTGQVLIRQAGTVTFSTETDDGSRLYIDGRLVVDNAGLHSPLKVTGSAELSAGYHDVELVYFERTGGAQAILRYDPGDGGGERLLGSGVVRARGLQDLSFLAGLQQLRLLSATNNSLQDPGPLAGLAALQTVMLQNNAILTAGALVGQYWLDDGYNPRGGYSESGLEWLGNRLLVSGAYDGTYRYHAGGVLGTGAVATWDFTGLPAGTYSVLVTWPEHASRASDAHFGVADGTGAPLIPDGGAGGELVVNQRLAPSGPVLQGRPWQALGTFTLTGDRLVVSLNAAGADGSVAADAVRLVRVGSVLPALRTVDLRGNPLDAPSLDQFLPALRAAHAADAAFSLRFDPDARTPVWTSQLAPQGSTGGGLTLTLSAVDPDADPVVFSAFSDSIDVSATVAMALVSGSLVPQLSVTSKPSFSGTVHITLVAGDRSGLAGLAAGRTARYVLDVEVKSGAIYGAKYSDPNQNGARDPGEPGIEGWTVFLDLNGDGVLQGPQSVPGFSGAVSVSGRPEGTIITDPAGVATFSVLDARNGGLLPGLGGNPQQVLVQLEDGAPVFGSNTSTEHWWGYLHDGSLRVDFSKLVSQVTVTVGYAALFGTGLTRPTLIAHDAYGRVIARASLDLAPSDASRDLTVSVPMGAIAWVELNTPSDSEPVLIRGVRYANATGLAAGELSALTDATGEYGFTGLLPGAYSVQEAVLSAWKAVSPGDLLIAGFAAGDVQGFATTGPWHLSSRRAGDPGHSGPASFYFGDEATGQYGANSGGLLTSPVIDLSSITGQVSLDFSYFLGSTVAPLTLIGAVADFSNGASPSPDGFTPVPVGAGNPWHLTSLRSGTAGHTAPTSMYFGSDATQRYAANQTGAVVSGPIDLRSVSGRATLDFNYFLSASPASRLLRGDIATVTVIDGTTRTVVAQNGSLRPTLHNTTAFESASMDLSRFAGHIVQVEFAFSADSDTAVGEGWYIDDVRVRGDVHDVATVSVVSAGSGTLLASNVGIGGLTESDGTTGWQKTNLDLSAFAGQKIQLQFGFQSDALGAGEGFYVDDVAVRLGNRAPVALVAGQVVVGKDFGGVQVVNAGSDQVVNEGTQVRLVALVTDPDPSNGSHFGFLWHIVASNGQVVPDATGPLLTFTPLDDGRYTATVSVTDLDAGGAVREDSAVVFVENVPPTGTLTSGPSAEAGQSMTFTGSLSDPGSDSWQVQVDFGDGSTLLLPNLTARNFSFSHVFASAGTYSVTATLLDDDGGRSAPGAVAATASVRESTPSPVVSVLPLNGGLDQRSTVDRIVLQFNVNVGPTLDLADLRLENLTTGTVVSPTLMALAYDTLGNRATLTFPGLQSRRLADGSYRLTLEAGSVASPAGRELSQAFVVNFQALAGDSNGDGVTNDLDLYRIWRNQLKPPGASDPNADLNGDGRVDATDLGIVRGHYLSEIVSPGRGSAPVPEAAGRVDEFRILDLGSPWASAPRTVPVSLASHAGSPWEEGLLGSGEERFGLRRTPRGGAGDAIGSGVSPSSR